MAQRTISTKLAIEGEAQYRAALTNINSELKVLQSSLKLVQSEYAGNANSMAALTAKGEALNRLHETQAKKVQALQAALQNAQGALSAYQQKNDTLKATLEANTKAFAAMSDANKAAGKEWAAQQKIIAAAEAELKKLQRSSQDTSAAQNELKAKIDAAKTKMAELEKQTGGAARAAGELIVENDKLNKELTENEKYLAAAQKGTNEWEVKLNSAKVELNNLDAEIQKNNRYLDEAAKSADGCAESMDEFGNETDDSAKSVDTLAQALTAAGIAKTLEAIAKAFDACVQSSIEYESAMAGVAKTTDLTEEELATMSENIKQLSTEIPLAATELANISEVAGQLGVAKDDLLGFTSVMANLGVATNMTSEEAATMLAQFTAVTGMDTSFYENLGSAVVALGNNFATNERKIVDMTQNIAAAGANANMTEAEMLALSAAVTSVGIEAANGGTQMSKLINDMKAAVETGKGLEDWAKAAGMSAQEFSRLWGEDATAAVAAFIGNINHLDSSATVMLNTLGITETRMVNMITALANAEDKTGLLTRAITTSNQAWEENTALVKEATTRYETTESRLQLLKNNFENVKIAVGDQLTPALGELYDVGADILGWIADTIQECDYLVPVIAAITTALTVFIGSLTAYVAATKLATIATKAFDAVLSTSKIGLVITAVAALAAGIGVLVATIDSSVPSVKELTEASRECSEAINVAAEEYDATAESVESTAALAGRYAERLRELEAAGLNTNEAQNEYRIIVDKLNSILPELNLTLDEQTGLLEGGTEALLENVEAWKKMALEEALIAKYSDTIDAYAAAELELVENQVKLNDAQQRGQELQAAYNEAQQKYIDLSIQITEETYNSANATWEYNEELGNLKYQQQEVEIQMQALESQMLDVEQEEENLTEAIEINKATLAEHEAVVEEARNTLDAFTASQQENTAATGENTSMQEAAAKAAESVSLSLGALAQAYKEAYDSARESLDGQIGIWDEMDNEAKTSADTLKQAVDSQVEYLQSYQANMESLLSRNIEGIREFAANFTDGSTESAAALAGLASATDAEISAIISSMSQVNEYKDTLASIFAELDTNLQGSLAALSQNYADTIAEITGSTGNVDFSPFISAVESAFANVGMTFEQAGTDAGSGLEAGIEASRSGVETGATAMAQAVIDAVRTALDSHSPSQVMKEIGEGVPEGMKQGVEATAPELKTTVTTLCEEIISTMEQGGTDSVESFINAFDQVKPRTQSILSELSSYISSSMSGLPGEMNSIGYSMVDGMISGLNSGSSSLYSTIRGIVNRAIDAARSAADSHSPSRKTIELFEDIDEGMIVGAKNKADLVAKTLQDVVDQALELDVKKRIPQIAEGIDDSMPSIHNISNQSSTTDNSRSISFGDIYVMVESRDGGELPSAAVIGEDVADELERKLRYRGII